MAVKQFLNKAKKLQEQQHHPRKVEEQRSDHAVHDESNWLVSYADMMTLLCGFFIMLFSMAKLDNHKYEQVKESIASKFGGTYQSPVDNTAKFVSQIIQEMGIEKQAVVRSDASGVAVTFESTLFFDTLSSDVKKEGSDVINRLIQGVSTLQSRESRKYRIVVEGHTDSRPVLSGIFPSNWELSGARAAKVVRMFLDQGFTPDHLTAIGYADTYPAVNPRFPNGSYDNEALAKNRRVVVRIMDPKVDSIPLPEPPREIERMPAAQRAPVPISAGAPLQGTMPQQPINNMAGVNPNGGVPLTVTPVHGGVTNNPSGMRATQLQPGGEALRVKAAPNTMNATPVPAQAPAEPAVSAPVAPVAPAEPVSVAPPANVEVNVPHAPLEPAPPLAPAAPVAPAAPMPPSFPASSAH